jgi:hypothetical protein
MRRSLDQFQRERAYIARLLDAVNVRDVGMVERGQHFGFGLKPRQPIQSRRRAQTAP